MKDAEFRITPIKFAVELFQDGVRCEHFTKEVDSEILARKEVENRMKYLVRDYRMEISPDASQSPDRIILRRKADD